MDIEAGKTLPGKQRVINNEDIKIDAGGNDPIGIGLASEMTGFKASRWAQGAVNWKSLNRKRRNAAVIQD